MQAARSGRPPRPYSRRQPLASTRPGRTPERSSDRRTRAIEVELSRTAGPRRGAVATQPRGAHRQVRPRAGAHPTRTGLRRAGDGRRPGDWHRGVLPDQPRRLDEERPPRDRLALRAQLVALNPEPAVVGDPVGKPDHANEDRPENCTLAARVRCRTSPAATFPSTRACFRARAPPYRQFQKDRSCRFLRSGPAHGTLLGNRPTLIANRPWWS